jgi:hypothetical protein
MVHHTDRVNQQLINNLTNLVSNEEFLKELDEYSDKIDDPDKHKAHNEDKE